MPSSNDEWLDFCEEIDDGEHDDGLEHLMRAIVARREVINIRNARRLIRILKKGDRVMITNNITPRYYEGMVGTVREMRADAAVVILDELPSGRGRPSAAGKTNKVLIPFVHLVRLDEDDIRAQKPAPKPDPEEVGDDEEYEDEDDDDDDD